MDGKRPEHLQLTATQMRDPSVLGNVIPFSCIVQFLI